MSLTAIIIPCYNEEHRLPAVAITIFLKQHPAYHFVLVDDGSTDKTGLVINELANEIPGQLFKLELHSNVGKANAVRKGFRFSLDRGVYSFVGYWDADFSTGLEELTRLMSIIENQKLDFAFGSRMKKLNAHIERTTFRHITGRMITTAIDSYFNLGIYDTQCGAKIFSSHLAALITKDPFVTRWLFDVEIFLRLRNLEPAASGEEVPLTHWVSQKGSKITIFNGPSLLIEFIKLIRAYPGKAKSNV